MPPIRGDRRKKLARNGHKFDDGGSRLDATVQSNELVERGSRTTVNRGPSFVDQFNALDVGGGLHHNGKQVLGESLGDLGGLKMRPRPTAAPRGEAEPQEWRGSRPINASSSPLRTCRAHSSAKKAKRFELNTDNHPPCPSSEQSEHCRTCPSFTARLGVSKAMRWCVLRPNSAVSGEHTASPQRQQCQPTRC